MKYVWVRFPEYGDGSDIVVLSSPPKKSQRWDKKGWPVTWIKVKVDEWRAHSGWIWVK